MSDGEISADFFQGDPVACARELIGSVLYWRGCSGRIVETKAYRTVGDEACHTFFRPSVRKFVEGCRPGDAYVYLNYGVHLLLNIVVKGGGYEGFVLIRALEPLEGIGAMRERRGGKEDRLLTSGPGRLTQALGVTKQEHGLHFLGRPDTGIMCGVAGEILEGPRIGISKAKELPWRYGERGSQCLSKPFAVQGNLP